MTYQFLVLTFKIPIYNIYCHKNITLFVVLDLVWIMKAK